MRNRLASRRGARRSIAADRFIERHPGARLPDASSPIRLDAVPRSPRPREHRSARRRAASRAGPDDDGGSDPEPAGGWRPDLIGGAP
jgi:hypothetical protein